MMILFTAAPVPPGAAVDSHFYCHIFYTVKLQPHFSYLVTISHYKKCLLKLENSANIAHALYQPLPDPLYIAALLSLYVTVSSSASGLIRDNI